MFPKPFRATLLTSGALTLVLVPVGQALAQDAVPPASSVVPLTLKPSHTLFVPAPDASGESAPLVFIRADQILNRNDKSLDAEGHAEVRRPGLVLTADHIHYDQINGTVDAQGHMQVIRNDQMTVLGPHGVYNLNTYKGFVDSPTFSYVQETPRPIQARGDATKIDFLSSDKERLTNAEYTSCPVGQNEWLIRSKQLDLNHSDQTGESHDATVLFQDVPILYAPDFTFPLNDQRKSGVLAPTIGTTSTTGQDDSIPYYFNLAPNYDDTLTGRYMSLRGVQADNEFRYLEPSFGGVLDTEYMPHDIIAGGDRWFMHFMHHETLMPGLTLTVDTMSASDPNYLVDLSSLLGPPGMVYLPHELDLTYDNPNWHVNMRSLSFQDLVGAAPQTRVEPQIDAKWSQNNETGPNLDFVSQYISLVSPGPNASPGNVVVNGITYNPNYQSINSGTRSYAYPTITFPWSNSYSYVKLKTGVSFTEYQIGEYNTSPYDHYSRTLPITSVDSGLFLDKATTLFGRAMTQTLEPRLYYVYIPYRNQSMLPVYDTAVADFNASTIFTENRFDGIDRINNANQVTAAVTTRLIDPATGQEMLNALVGQRFYFSPNQVLLPGEVTTQPQASDVLISLASAISDQWRFDSYFDFDSHNLHTQQMMAGTTYTPAPGKVFNLSYRIDTPIPGVPTSLVTPLAITTYIPGLSPPINYLTSVKQWDISNEWPLSSRVAFLGRVAYSTLDNKVVEDLGGIEYNEGCWALRLVTTRFAITSLQTASAFFVQLELGALGLGQNPLQALSRNIPGYVKTNEITP